jgi:hypothetical protein
MESLRAPLPITFRINGRGKFAADLRDRLEQDFFSQFDNNMLVCFFSEFSIWTECVGPMQCFTSRHSRQDVQKQSDDAAHDCACRGALCLSEQ